MTTGNTTLLGLALPVEGELDGTWGDVVNDSITSLLDSAIAGTTTISADADVTLTDTVLAANQSRQAIILWTASNGATTRNITAPARSKAYIVINAGTGSVVLRGAGPTTGVTIVSGERCMAAWNGSDFTKVSTSVVDGVDTISFGSTGLTPSTATSGAVTVSGTLAVANGGTGVTTSTGTGSVVLSDSPTLVTPALGTPSSGTLTNATGLPIVAGTTGTLSVDRGGTGATSLTANNVILGNGTSAVQVVSPSSSGNVLTSNGTTWQSTAPSVTTSNTATLTNKRITPRIVSITDAATITPTGDTADQYVVTALAQPATIATPSGTPTDGQKLTIRIEDNGVARVLTWTTTSGAYRAVGATLPATTNASKALYVGCIYNAQDVFWDVVAVAQQA